MSDQQAELRRLKEQAEATERLRQAREHGNRQEAERAHSRLTDLRLQSFARHGRKLWLGGLALSSIIGALSFIGSGWLAGILGAVGGLVMGHFAFTLMIASRLRTRIAGWTLAIIMAIWSVLKILEWLALIGDTMTRGTP